MRDSNGMSFSSRYSTFSKDERSKFKKCAQIINANLLKFKRDFDHKILDNIKKELRSYGISKIDYIEVRNEEDLSLSINNERTRLFIAFYLNKVRVIDNFLLY